MKKRILKLLTVLLITITISGCGNNVDKVRNKMEKYLYEKYGEEFVVDRIGRRSANGQEFYQARIYPKSIIGTNREDDDYYYASSSIDIKSFGRLGKPGDSYSFINRNDDVENYLLPKAKEIFGERIRLKVDVKHEVTGDGSWWAGYKSSSLQEMRDDIKEYPDTTRIVLNLYVYIFDRIETEEEKSRRREETFEFLNYLKGENLGEYLKLYTIIADEIVLAPNFDRFEGDLNYNKDKDKKIEKILREEVKMMNREQIIESIKKLKKSDLAKEKKEKLHIFSQLNIFIITMEMLKIDKYGRYEKAKKNNELERHLYKKPSDVEMIFYNSYIYPTQIKNEEGKTAF